MAKEHQDKSDKKGGKAHGGFTANPGSGVSDDKKKKSGSKKGPALMSQASWDKLSKKTQEIEFHGSRFSGSAGEEARGDQ